MPQLSEQYTTVRQEAHIEFEEKRSLFIGHALHVETEEEAQSFIKQIKKKYSDATHNCFAYLLGDGSIARYSDDGEPQGTAGMPVLDVIRKNGVTDTVIVVVRYFGGILLGTGGLVHAYTEAALGALKAAKIIRYSTYSYFSLTVSYSDYQKITPALNDYGFVADDTDFTENVEIFGSVMAEDYEKIINKLTEITSGRCKFEFFEEKYDFRE